LQEQILTIYIGGTTELCIFSKLVIQMENSVGPRVEL
jgi:hypothetical protein